MFAKSPEERQPSNTLLQRAVQNFVDGILILTVQGERVHSNDVAHQICAQLAPEKLSPSLVPESIWKVCRASIQSHKSYVGQPRVIDYEINTDALAKLRVRVQWLKLDGINSPYLLVILENRAQTVRNIAVAEANDYGLTHREREIWLLRQANYTRKEIAAELYITDNTVKKHLKNIQLKRRASAYLDK